MGILQNIINHLTQNIDAFEADMMGILLLDIVLAYT